MTDQFPPIKPVPIPDGKKRPRPQPFPYRLGSLERVTPDLRDIG